MSDHAAHDSQDYGLANSDPDVLALTTNDNGDFTAAESAPPPDSPPPSPRETVSGLLEGYLPGSDPEDEDFCDASSNDDSSMGPEKDRERSPPPSDSSADTPGSQPASYANVLVGLSPQSPQAPSAEQQLAAAQATIAQLKEQLDQAHGQLGKRKRDKDSLPYIPAPAANGPANPALARVLHRPPTFNGSPKSNLRLWMRQMSQFLTPQGLEQRDAVFTAASYLVDDAAAFWLSESERLARKGIDVFHWRTFKDALFNRFGYKNAEFTARDRLHDLRQNKMSFAHYVNAFDDCYAHIPEFEEGDKIHRFLRGLRPEIQVKLKINPSTGRLWTRYNAMVAFGHVLINDLECSAEIIRDITSHGKPPHNGSDPRSYKKARIDHSVGNASQARNGSRDDKVPAVDINNGLEKQFTVCKPTGNVTFSRDRKVARYCMGRKLCAHCYGKGHSPNHCRSSKKEGFPPGFDPNHKPKARQQ
jgi:hypothetical protein